MVADDPFGDLCRDLVITGESNSRCYVITDDLSRLLRIEDVVGIGHSELVFDEKGWVLGLTEVVVVRHGAGEQ